MATGESEPLAIGVVYMKFFVDTADVAEIKDLAASGLLDGVTTNPSLIMKAGRPPAPSRPSLADADTGLKAFLDDWAETGQSIL